MPLEICPTLVRANRTVIRFCPSCHALNVRMSTKDSTSVFVSRLSPSTFYSHLKPYAGKFDLLYEGCMKNALKDSSSSKCDCNETNTWSVCGDQGLAL